MEPCASSAAPSSINLPSTAPTTVPFSNDALTSGSTWYAAANFHGLRDATNICRPQHYTMQSCGIGWAPSISRSPAAPTKSGDTPLGWSPATPSFRGFAARLPSLGLFTLLCFDHRNRSGRKASDGKARALCTFDSLAARRTSFSCRDPAGALCQCRPLADRPLHRWQEGVLSHPERLRWTRATRLRYFRSTGGNENICLCG